MLWSVCRGTRKEKKHLQKRAKGSGCNVNICSLKSSVILGGKRSSTKVFTHGFTCHKHQLRPPVCPTRRSDDPAQHVNHSTFPFISDHFSTSSNHVTLSFSSFFLSPHKEFHQIAVKLAGGENTSPPHSWSSKAGQIKHLTYQRRQRWNQTLTKGSITTPWGRELCVFLSHWGCQSNVCVV